MPIGNCFRCHQPGHWANHCPLKTSINPLSSPPPFINQSAPATASLAQTAIPIGGCFHCHQPGHWARNCPLKSATTPPPVINCPCGGGACKVLTSGTEKNPNKKFYKCPAVPNCEFFKWCDEVIIVESQPISVNPTCPCGSGPCRKQTVIDGPDANRSYFVCCIKKGFGACEFFQWEDEVAQIPSEPEEVGHGNSPCSTSIGFSGFDSADDENSTRSNHFTLFKPREKENERFDDRIAQPVKDYADTLPVNAITVGKESIPVCSSFNNLEFAFNGADCRNQVYEDVVGLEKEEQALSSLTAKHTDPQMEALCSESYEMEVVEAMRGLSVTGFCQNTSDLVSNKPNHQSTTTSGETRASFSGGLSLIDLIERYNLEKLRFKSVSTKHVDALTAFTGSYKQLELLRDRAHSLRKQLLQVENQVKYDEAETSELATSLRRVSSEMVKSQKKMVETGRKVANEVRVYNKQRDFAAL